MPAVLLELAFVTNPTEYKYLSSSDGQAEIAGRLFDAFAAYKSKFDASVNVQETSKPVTAQPSVSDVPAKSPLKGESKVNKYYSIQVMGLGRYLKSGDPAFKGLDCHAVKSESSTIYKYVCGRYESVAGATSALSSVRRKFPEAFVVEVEGDVVKRVK